MPFASQKLTHRNAQIVYTEFPIPRPYPIVESLGSQNQYTSIGTPGRTHSTVQISQTPTTPRALPPVPAFPGSSAAETATSHVPNSQPDQTRPSSNDQTSPDLPLVLVRQLNSIIATLRASFYTCPPHTIQRLSELTLDPRRHYKTLPAWLRAVDRVVSVSSTADIFPLSDTPTVVNGINGDGAGGILWNNGDHPRNGVDVKERDGGLGSDESLGGALLTPIPWLREVESNNTNDTDSTNGDLEGAGIGADTSADDFLGDEIHFTAANTITPSSTATLTSSIESSDTDASNNHSSPSQSSQIPLTLSTHNNDPLVPDRPLGAVTQGELIRMEQEAGVIPVSHSASSSASLPRTGRTEHTPSIALGVGIGLDDGTGPIGGTGGEQDEMLDEVTPHARGPQLVGTVDTGLVGGKGVEVDLSSSPDREKRENKSNINVHNAQNVLAGGKDVKNLAGKSSDKSHGEDATDTNSTETSDIDTGTKILEDDYVDVGNEIPSELKSKSQSIPENEDAMQLDEQSQNKDISKEATNDNDDGDIILVDADGATEEERHQIDSTDLNVGSETADGSAV